MSFKSAYIAIIGLPNSGKSTLLNQLLGKQLVIVSNKPQTTRNKILGIRTEEDRQMLFLDTPGWYKGTMKIDKFFRGEVKNSLVDADVVFFLIDGKKSSLFKNKELGEVVQKASKAPVILLVNKMDITKQSKLIPVLEELNKEFPWVEDIIPISGKEGTNIDVLMDVTEKHMHEGPQWYPEENLTDRSNPFLISEFVREALFGLLDQELPFCVAVVIEDYKEEEKKIFAKVSVYVERDGQKMIVVGEDGWVIKRTKGLSCMRARKFFGKKIEMDLRVKVKKNWRQNENILRQVGYRN